ncbi:GntR family transcriptional regulator [Streptococcus suis]
MRDTSTKQSLYYQLFDSLVEYIQNELSPNDQLPTEKEIGEEYSVSRTTVRLAMQELENRGYIYRIQGKGSFVSSLKQENHNSFYSLDFKNHYDGLEPSDFSTNIISFSTIEAPLALKQLFGLHHPSTLLKIQLEHQLNTEVIAKETIITKEHCFPFLTADYLAEFGFDQAIRDGEILIKAIEESYDITSFSSTSPVNDALKLKKSFYSHNNELILISTRTILIHQFAYTNFLWSNQ